MAVSNLETSLILCPRGHYSMGVCVAYIKNTKKKKTNVDFLQLVALEDIVNVKF